MICLVSAFYSLSYIFHTRKLQSLNYFGFIYIFIVGRPTKMGPIRRKGIDLQVFCSVLVGNFIVMYLYKSTIRPCMEYCSHILGGTLRSHGLDLLDQVKKRVVTLSRRSGLSSDLQALSQVVLQVLLREMFL